MSMATARKIEPPRRRIALHESENAAAGKVAIGSSSSGRDAICVHQTRCDHSHDANHRCLAAVSPQLQEIAREFMQRRGRETLALATLVRTTGSSYLRRGARMLISSRGETFGLLSGGCIEEEVAIKAQGVMKTGTSCLLTFDTRPHFGCSGALEISVEKIEADDPFLLALNRCVEERVSFEFGAEAIDPPLQLIVAGGGRDSAPLVAIARTLGWKVVMAEAPEQIRADRHTVAVVKTHNYGRDFAFLRALLPFELAYIGLVGSRRRKEQLVAALIDVGADLEQTKPIHGPAGLDVGSATPEEIALSIVAEIQAVLASRPHHSLRDQPGSHFGGGAAAVRRCALKRNIAAIVLAAGASSRMGAPKQLLHVGTSTLLRHSVEQALASDVRATFAVIGAEAETMRRELRDLPVTIVENTRWAEGLGTSVAAGVRCIVHQQPAFEAAVLMTCDQPHVTAATINTLVAECESSGKPMVAAAYGDTVGVPALFAHELFDRLLHLPPNCGAKTVLLQRPDDVAVVNFEAGAVDLDTPADYERFIGGDIVTS
jgi:xanthine/CO dehydrogenase XdhC/CoxF family maturation factor/CTP:molybdopterin cytidylyltransferase MocA